jgi:hypothetical protein
MKHPRRYIPFALVAKEVTRCALCGCCPESAEYRREHGKLGTWFRRDARFFLDEGTIGGLFGFCVECGLWLEESAYNVPDEKSRYLTSIDYDRLGQDWRRHHLDTSQGDSTGRAWSEKPPAHLQILDGLPIWLIVRGECDDAALAKLIGETLNMIPEQPRQCIFDYILSPIERSTTRRGMRFEALGSWLGMRDASGACLDYGLAIRLRASAVNVCPGQPVSSIKTTIAHEIARTSQKADGKKFATSDECERDLEDRLRQWGFEEAGTTEDARQRMIDRLEALITVAEHARETIRSACLPSRNYASKADSQLQKARRCLETVERKWRGLD